MKLGLKKYVTIFSLILSANLSSALASETVLMPADNKSAIDLGPVIFSPNLIVFRDGSSMQIEHFPVRGEEKGGRFYKIISTQGEFDAADDCEGQVGFVAQISDDNSDYSALLFINGDPVVQGPEAACARYQMLTANAPTKTPEGKAFAGKWKINRQKNADGTENVVIALPSENVNNSQGDPYHFVARCLDNTTDAFLATGDQTAGKAVMVTTALDGGKPRNMAFWGLSSDSRAAFVPGWAGEFLKEIVDAKQMTLNVAPKKQLGVDVDFDLRGMKAALMPIAENCNWQF